MTTTAILVGDDIARIWAAAPGPSAETLAITTTAFDAFPDAPTPTTLDEAIHMLAETRRLLGEAGVTVRPVATPKTLRFVLEQLAVDRETLAETLRTADGGKVQGACPSAAGSNDYDFGQNGGAT